MRLGRWHAGREGIDRSLVPFVAVLNQKASVLPALMSREMIRALEVRLMGSGDLEWCWMLLLPGPVCSVFLSCPYRSSRQSWTMALRWLHCAGSTITWRLCLPRTGVRQRRLPACRRLPHTCTCGCPHPPAKADAQFGPLSLLQQRRACVRLCTSWPTTWSPSTPPSRRCCCAFRCGQEHCVGALW